MMQLYVDRSYSKIKSIRLKKHPVTLVLVTSTPVNISFLGGLVAELSKALFSGAVNAPAALSALCHWGFESCASFELERWREFVLSQEGST